MKRYLFIKLIYSLILFSFLILPLFSLAASSSFVCPTGMSISDCQKQKLGEVYGKSYGTTAGSVTSLTISQKIGLIVSYALAFLGVIFLVLVVFSGFQWMTAGGNEEKITQARTRLINAVLGLAIILAAYSITWFITNKLLTTFSPPPEPIACTAIQSPAGKTTQCLTNEACTTNSGTIVEGVCSTAGEICCQFTQ